MPHTDVAPKWLPRAKAVVFPDPDGETEAGYVQFRTGKALRSEKPDPNRPLVSMLLDGEGRPVSVHFCQPLSSLGKTRVIHALLVAADESRGEGPYTPSLSADFIDSAIHAMDEVNAAFPREWDRDTTLRRIE